MRSNHRAVLLTLATLTVITAGVLAVQKSPPPQTRAEVAIEAVDAIVEPVEGESAAVVAYSCQPLGSFTSPSEGMNYFRGNVIRVDNADAIVKLRLISMEMRFTGNVDLYFSIHRAPSADTTPTFREIRRQRVTRSGTGLVQMVSSDPLAVELPAGFDYVIGVAWTRTDVISPLVKVANGGFGAALPEFLHGATVGLVALNSVIPPMPDPLPSMTIFTRFGAYSMELCFDPVEGACCMAPSGCLSRTEADCVGDGSFFHGERTSCAETPCTYGACCGPCGGSANCAAEYTRDACEASGDEWAGADVACSDALCPIITGACCNGATCTEQCIDDCIAGGGEYLGDATACFPNMCAGACCIDDFGCADTTRTLCNSIQTAVFHAEGTTCAALALNDECGGACCATLLGRPICVDVAQRDECTAAAGLTDPTYMGDGSSCAPDGFTCPAPTSGACCFPDERCSITTRGFCEDEAGGSFSADTTCQDVACTTVCCVPGVTEPDSCVVTPDAGGCTDAEPSGLGGSIVVADSCVPDPCNDVLGACCLMDRCLDPASQEGVTRTECDLLGGRFKPDGQCCGALLGACCRPSGGCADLHSDVDCVGVLGGEYKGDGTVCEDVAADCDLRGGCCTDSGMCVFVLELECNAITGDNSGRHFRGVGAACAADSCAAGACCLDDGTEGLCAVVREDLCLTTSYLGTGTSCEPGVCKSGACCTAGGTCSDTLPSECRDDEFSSGASCVADSCEVGACCRDGDCFHDTLARCQSESGVYQGVDVSCDGQMCNLGSCCFRDKPCDDPLVASQCDPIANETVVEFRPNVSCLSALVCEPVGACCLPERVPPPPEKGELCVPDRTASECEERNGLLSPGLTCADAACTEFGACCMGDGTCELLGGTECTDAGGAYLGDGELCTPDRCTLGACCVDESCNETFEENCTGGLYLGINTPCLADTCDIGSCCEADGSCTDDVIATQCDVTGGLEFRAGMTCADEPCGDTGACCSRDGGCEDGVIGSDCLAIGGVFSVFETCSTISCEPLGACCLEELCSEVSLADCAAQGGNYLGHESTCGLEGLCESGACCHYDGTCDENVVETQCTGGRDVFRPGQACISVCTPRGACCNANRCTEGKTARQCSDEDGSYSGDGTICETDPCAFGPCCSLSEPPCQSLSRPKCAEIGGVFGGPNVSCQAVDDCGVGSCCELDGTCVDNVYLPECPAPGVFRLEQTCETGPSCMARGACCMDDGTCELLTAEDCPDLGGVYTADGEPCDPLDRCRTGACCRRDGSCAERTRDSCENNDGFYRGADTVCDGAGDCTRGACCELDGTCFDDTIAPLCTASGAEFTPDAGCSQLNCGLRGACCRSGACTIESQAACLLTGGTHEGTGVACDPNPCDPLRIVDSLPDDCTIFARQPTEPDGSGPILFNFSLLTFNGDATGIPESDFEISVLPEPSVPPPDLDSIIRNGNTLTFVFHRTIPVGKWLCITHLPSGTGMCMGYLPGDVNGDTVSSVEDALKLMDCLSSGQEGPEFQCYCDIDGSQACGPADLLRLIDLLNGAGVYDPWLDFSIGACPSP